MSKSSIAVVAVLYLGGTAYGAPQSPKSALISPPKYCADAGTWAEIGGVPRDVVAKVYTSCKAGDRVTFPSQSIGVIMLACDPAKPVTTIGHEIACTLAR